MNINPDFFESFIFPLLTAMLGGAIVAALTHLYNRNREKTKLLFDLHAELNSAEMALHRRNAYSAICDRPNVKFNRLGEHETSEVMSLYILMRFYERLWQNIRHHEIRTDLVHSFFAEIFYQYYFLSFKHNLVGLQWDVADHISQLAKWFEEHDHRGDYLKSKAEYEHQFAKLKASQDSINHT